MIDIATRPLPRKALSVGIARLDGLIYPKDALPYRGSDRCSGDEKWHMHEQWGFRLSHVERLPFVPCKGHLGFFDVPLSVLQDLRERVTGPLVPTLPEAAHG